MTTSSDSQTEAKDALLQCLRKCAEGRERLRTCMLSAMDAGLSKTDALAIIDEAGDKNSPDTSLCLTVAAGEVIRYAEAHSGERPPGVPESEKMARAQTVRNCLDTCMGAKNDLHDCVVRALDTGLSKEAILFLVDEIIHGVARDNLSLCGIVAVSHVLNVQEALRKEPIDILEERREE